MVPNKSQFMWEVTFFDVNTDMCPDGEIQEQIGFPWSDVGTCLWARVAGRPAGQGAWSLGRAGFPGWAGPSPTHSPLHLSPRFHLLIDETIFNQPANTSVIFYSSR